ncbi:AzlD domain-containing protein [Holdemania massiliensis]|uniref:AzlD domain-containing protein n=1 Tax=Holdemania massiliensis TaxID=1468449 RepID=UPI001F06CB17|nr:AzlD domain-containing protein [Holdemania massiliensis]MCH1941766.1 AzlD domain-containing protein [Holdemania massiliensis]
MINKTVFLYTLVMAGVTYLLRAAPILIFQKKIENTFIQSFLFYVPYAVLAAMTFPAILMSTRSGLSAAAGLLIALILGWRGKGLLTVALAACAAVYLVELIIL